MDIDVSSEAIQNELQSVYAELQPLASVCPVVTRRPLYNFEVQGAHSFAHVWDYADKYGLPRDPIMCVDEGLDTSAASTDGCTIDSAVERYWRDLLEETDYAVNGAHFPESRQRCEVRAKAWAMLCGYARSTEAHVAMLVARVEEISGTV